MVAGLEERGHSCRLLLYDPPGTQSVAEFETIAKRHFPTVAATVDRFGPEHTDAVDAIIATSWPTAYPAATVPTSARRLYFVQDFEPSFYPVGSDYALAENTYRLGLEGITLGTWLSELLEERYGMRCNAIDFQVDVEAYRYSGRIDRAGVLFYARPSSPRRAFELGILALELFADEHPNIPIHLFGGDLAGQRVPFHHVQHGILDQQSLNTLYNSASAGLVLSMTNLSLLPMELLATGCLPIVNDGANNTMNLLNSFVTYAAATPRALADALQSTVRRAEDGGVAFASAAAASVAASSWTKSVDQFERALIGEGRWTP